MDKFVMGEVYVSKCVDTLFNEYKVLNRTPCFVTTDRGKFRVNEFIHKNGELDEYFVDRKNHETIVYARDTYKAMNMDGILKAREKRGATNDRRSQVQA